MVVGFRKQEAVVGIFAFEVASVMSRLVHLWESLSYEQVDRLRIISGSVGLKKLVSHDDDFIRGLIPGELFENMIPLTKFVARLGKNHCSDPRLKDFEHAVGDFINHGVDPFGWVLPYEEMGKEAKKMESFMSVTAVLHDRMKLVSHLEGTRNHMDGPIWLEIQNKIELKRLDVAKLKRSLCTWNMNFNHIGILLARSVFTIFSRIKSVFGVPQLMAKDTDQTSSTPSPSIFSEYNLLDAPPDTLGAAALVLKYADIVILIEYLVRSPVYVYTTRRDKLYNMLPAKMRAKLSERLPPVQSSTCSSIKDVAAEKNVAMLEMLEWLAPLAHNTNKWHSMWKRKQKAYASTRSHVLLVQTPYLASQQKTEAAIMELIVGLQYKRRAAEMLCGLEDKAEASIVLEESKSVTV